MALLDFFNMKYPSTDFHELNLDWCISAILQLQKYMEEFTAGNKLIFADPLQHDLTKTYAKNTIVLDDAGNAYLSLDTVPKGVQLSNANYWLMVFNFEDYTEKANKNFTDNYFRDTTRAPYTLEIGDWIVLNDVLYEVIADIASDELFEVGVNIVHFTVEQFIKQFVNTVNQTLSNYSLTIQQYKNDIDASELAYRQQLAQDIADTTATLSAQLEAAIAGVTVDSEVIDARVGVDGKTYSTLGNAIRTQVQQDKDNNINTGKVISLKSPISFDLNFEAATLSLGVVSDSTTRIISDYIYIGNLEKITADIATGYKYAIVRYDADKEYKSDTTWLTTESDIESGDTTYKAIFVRFIIANSDGVSPISVNEGTALSVTGTPLIKKFLDTVDRFYYVDLKDSNYWYAGTRTNDGVIVSNNIRISSEFVKVKKGDRIFTTYDASVVRMKYYVEAVYFDEKMNHIASTGWQSNLVTSPYDGYVSIILRKGDNSDISAADKADMIDNFYFRHKATNLCKQFSDVTVRRAINHRGWGNAPENTLIAYKESFEHKFRYVECDVRFTSDDVAVLLHDATINRTARNPDGTEIEGTIYVSALTYAQTQYYDFGIYKGPQYAGTKMPTFAEFLELCKSLNLCPYVDMGGTSTRAEIERIAEIVDENGCMGSATFVCGGIAFAEYISELYPAARIVISGDIDGLILRSNAASIPTGINEVAIFSNIDSVVAHPEYIETFRYMGIGLEVWNVLDTSQLDDLDEYVSGVATDTINTETYYMNKAKIPISFTSPEISNTRSENISGGFYVKDGIVFVYMQFDSLYTANDTPEMFYDLPTPISDKILISCVEIDSDGEIQETEGCYVYDSNNILTLGKIFIERVKTGSKYLISGQYMMK